MAFAGTRGRPADTLPAATGFAGGQYGIAPLTQDVQPEPSTEAEATAEPPSPPLASFSLELALPVEAAARLTRHPAIALRRLGRARGSAAEIVWLDSADGLLAANGLVLEQAGRAMPWLRRCLPKATTPWCPGQPAAAEDSAPDSWEAQIPVPMAAFTGRRSLLTLQGQAPLELDLLQGRLRTVASEAPAARLRLTGDATEVLGLAQALTADLPLLPSPDLAEAALGLARLRPPRARRKGAPDVQPGSSMEAALLAVTGHLLEVMLQHAPGCTLQAGPEGVHQLRVALRRLRSALRNFRPLIGCPEVDAFDKSLARLARHLGPARDWDVFLAGLGAELATAVGQDQRCAQLLRAAEARRLAAYTALREALDGPAFRQMIMAGIALVALRPWREAETPAPALDLPAEAHGSALLQRRWQKLRKQGEEIEALDAEALHELRLACKRLRYVAEIFTPLWPGKTARRFMARLAGVQEALGQANDMAVARGLVASLLVGAPGNGPVATPWAVGLAEGFALGRLGDTRQAGLETWEKLMDARPFWHQA